MDEEGVVSSRVADQQQEAAAMASREERDYETPAFLRKKLLNN